MNEATEDGYTPSPWGREFHARDEDEVMGAGAAGVGKSLVLATDPLPFIVLEDERARKKEIRKGESVAKFLHLRRELGMLEETIGRAKRMYPHVDPDVQFKEEFGKPTCIFRSGAKIIFGGCKDAGDFAQYETAEYLRVYYDELRQFEEEQYNQINTRCRTSDPVLAPFVGIRSASNPTPNWVRKRFVDPAPAGGVILREWMKSPSTGKKSARTRIFLKGTLYDNPNKAFIEQYELNLLSKPNHIRNALLYGDWYVHVGAYYSDDFRRDLHVIRPFVVPGHWTRFRSLDWGYKTWGCCLWWAINEDGDMICDREYSFRFKEATKVAERIREIEQDMGLWDEKRDRSKLTGPADTQLWEERGESGISKAEEMAHVGVTWVAAIKKAGSRRRAALRLITRLKDHGDGTGLPGIVWFETCRQCVKTIPGIEADPHDPEEPLKQPDDHWHDATLYAVSYRMPAGDEKGRDWYDEDDDDDKEERADRRRSRGNYGYGSF